MRNSWSLGVVLLAACIGEVEPRPGDAPAGDVVEVQPVSGRALDFFLPNMPLQGVTLATDGIAPQVTATSTSDGAFTFDRVPVGSQLFVYGTRATYRPTRNLLEVVDAAVVQDIYVMSRTDINRQYATDGKTPTAGLAFVAAELVRDNGTPMAGIPLSDVKLVDNKGAPVPGVSGPYVFGAAGDIVPTGALTESHGGKARIAFLDVPVGSFSLKVTFTDEANATQTRSTPFTTAPDGAAFVRSAGTGRPGGGAPVNPRFMQDVFPRLQTASNGGRGCVNCHTVGGQGAVAVFNALADDVLQSLKLKTGLIDLATPANSLLLTKPLYEPSPAPQNHPNATFVNTDDPDYKLILLWIQQGALL